MADVSAWVGVSGGIVAVLGAAFTGWRVWLDRRAGIDSKEVSMGDLTLRQIEALQVIQGENIARQAATISDQSELITKQGQVIESLQIELSEVKSELRIQTLTINKQDDRIDQLRQDRDKLVDHINNGGGPPPPELSTR